MSFWAKYDHFDQIGWIMVLNMLLGSIWRFGVSYLIWWIMESPIGDHEWLVWLILQMKEFMEAFWVCMER